ncbi:MAG: 4-hydroxythreonine-4-phosphate dehydrogenase PdxA [Desulfobulbaceae bacterium A2]|nr:MAG: 4-hydroxythreonine-4-phosphate dehydrogenase PdxA [Desulfobulbaceae bacterium A2]
MQTTLPISSSDQIRTPLAITMGCPVGIGPEIILKFYRRLSVELIDVPVVVGDIGVLRRTAELLRLPGLVVSWRPGDSVAQGTIPVLETSRLDATALGWGQPTMESGTAMLRAVETAVDCVLQGSLAGIVTCPVAKTALRLAGCPHPGHTELLAARTGCDRFAMMMAGDRLKVVLVTIHEALARVPALLTPDLLRERLALTHESLIRDFGLPEPRVAVAGLNPHAGEGGMFGHEEIRLIAPLVAQALAKGWRVSGPHPPDTVFYQAVAGRYDAVLAMYHDQGLIPFKLLHFRNGVNVTLGLPLVRTSVDHGTGYDIAGRGLASEESLSAAWLLAREMVARRGHTTENNP